MVARTHQRKDNNVVNLMSNVKLLLLELVDYCKHQNSSSSIKNSCPSVGGSLQKNKEMK